MMMELNNRIINENGSVFFKDDFFKEALFSELPNIFDYTYIKSKNIDEFNHWCEYYALDNYKLKVTEKPDSNKPQIDWLIPSAYMSLDILALLEPKCKTALERERLLHEYQIFNDRQLIPLLRFVAYLVDTMRNNNIVWGVGRGSSTTSYVLYLLGLNRINPMKYGLDLEDI